MKRFLKSIALAGALSLAASGLMAADAQVNPADQYFKAKYGRHLPQEEARLRAAQAETAFRQELPAAPEQGAWMDQYFKAKLGRHSPAVEARLKAERENTAFREEPARAVPARSWFDQWYARKYGRTPGR